MPALLCEQCQKTLPYEMNPEVSEGANAARAVRVGVVAKLFTLHGDDHGFRFFCSDACATQRRRVLFPNSDDLQDEINAKIADAKERLRREFERR